MRALRVGLGEWRGPAKKKENSRPDSSVVMGKKRE